MTYISGGTTKGLLRLTAPTTTPGLSVAGEGRIYFDGTQFQASQNGAAYTPVVGGGGGGGGWTDDGTVVRLTTATDQVGIGTAAPTAGAKLEIVGDSTNPDVLVTAGSGAVTGGTISMIAGQGGTGAGGTIVLRGGVGGSSANGGDAYVQSGLPLDGSGGSSGSVWIESRATSGFTAFEATGDVNIRSGDAEGGGSGSLNLTTGSNANGSSGSITISTGSPGGIASGGSITLTTSGGYTSGSIQLTANGGGGPGGGGGIGLTAGASVFVECGGGTDTITLQCNPGTPTTSVILDDTYFTVNAVLLPNGGLGDNTSNVNIETQSGSLGGNGTSLYITPNLGIILEIGNTIKIDPDGTNNWIYGDDATVAATPGEPLTLRGGQGNTTGAGGELRLRGGAGGATGAGSNAVIAGVTSMLRAVGG